EIGSGSKLSEALIGANEGILGQVFGPFGLACQAQRGVEQRPGKRFYQALELTPLPSTKDPHSRLIPCIHHGCRLAADALHGSIITRKQKLPSPDFRRGEKQLEYKAGERRPES